MPAWGGGGLERILWLSLLATVLLCLALLSGPHQEELGGRPRTPAPEDHGRQTW